MEKHALRSEEAILACIDSYFPAMHLGLRLGRGDDCCVLQPADALCVSTDMFMEDVHFRRTYFTPEDIGWKALAVNLSDLAACGAQPSGFSLGLALPDSADMPLVEGLFKGMAELARHFDVPLTGGDLTRADKIHLCLTVFGQSDAPGGALRRGVCQPGDSVFLVGRVGLARKGLALLEAQGRTALAHHAQACAALLRPWPRIKEGLRLAAMSRRDQARIGLMDVSDGLARDLPRLLNGSGIDLNLPLDDVLGGDDYALVGTCEPCHAATLMAMLPEATLLGTVTTGQICCNGHLLHGGFDHFAQRDNLL